MGGEKVEECTIVANEKLVKSFAERRKQTRRTRHIFTLTHCVMYSLTCTERMLKGKQNRAQKVHRVGARSQNEKPKCMLSE